MLQFVVSVKNVNALQSNEIKHCVKKANAFYEENKLLHIAIPNTLC